MAPVVVLTVNRLPGGFDTAFGEAKTVPEPFAARPPPPNAPPNPDPPPTRLPAPVIRLIEYKEWSPAALHPYRVPSGVKVMSDMGLPEGVACRPINVTRAFVTFTVTS